MQINKHLRELMLLDQKYAQNADQGRLRKTALDAAFDGPKPVNPVVSPTEYGGPLTPKSDLEPVPAGPVRDGSQYITGKGAGFPDIGPAPKEIDRAPGYAETPRNPASGMSFNGAPAVTPVRVPDKSPFEASQVPPVKPIVPSVISQPNIKTANPPAPVDPIAKGLAKLDANTQPAAPQQVSPFGAPNVDAAQRTMKAFVAKKEEEQYTIPNRLNNGLVDPTLVGIHKDLRDSLGLDLEVTSGFRDTDQNRVAGGAKKSKHLGGIAMDLRTSKLAPWERDSAIAKLIDNPNVGAVGVYPSGNVHVDLRKSPGNVKINGSDKTITSWGNGGSYNNSISPIVARIAAMDPTQRRALYEGDQPNGGGGDSGVAKSVTSADVIKHFEGFRNTPYWDVNAHRVGYGSDTVTLADGSVKRVTPGMTVSREDADRDLARRLVEFSNVASSGVGKEKWDSLPENVRAALTSVTYNYGELPASVTTAARSGDAGAIAASIRGLSGHNNGVNAKRRNLEADIVLGNVNPSSLSITDSSSSGGMSYTGGGNAGGGNAGGFGGSLPNIQAMINQAVAAALAGAQSLGQGAGQAFGTPIGQLPPVPQPAVRSDLRQPSPTDRGNADFVSQVPLTPQQAGSLIDLLQKLVGTGTPDPSVNQDVSIGSAL